MKRREKEELLITLKEKIIASKLNILTLDLEYHRLFDDFGKTREIEKLEEKVNDLLKERGQLNNDHKKLFKIKKEVMDKILVVANMNMAKQEEDSDELLELRERVQQIKLDLEDISDRLMELPYELEQANKELFIETMLLCYNNMEDKDIRREELDEEIKQLREEIQEKIIEKEELSKEVNLAYKGLHKVAGAHVANVLDDLFGGNND